MQQFILDSEDHPLFTAYFEAQNIIFKTDLEIQIIYGPNCFYKYLILTLKKKLEPINKVQFP